MPVFRVLCRSRSNHGPEVADHIVIAPSAWDAPMVVAAHRESRGQVQGRYHATKIADEPAAVRSRITRHFDGQPTTVIGNVEGLDEAARLAGEALPGLAAVTWEVMDAAGDAVMVPLHAPWLDATELESLDNPNVSGAGSSPLRS